MSGKEKIEAILSHLNLKAPTFASNIGVDYQRIFDIQRGKTKKVSGDVANAIVNKYPQFEINFLIGENTPMLKSGSIPISVSVPSLGLPIIPFDAVAGWNGIDNPGVSLDNLERYVVPEFTSKGAEFIIRVSGSSMYPKYSNGDLLACRKVHEILFFQWGKIYVIDSSQGAMIKRVYEDANPDMIICHSDNTEHYPKFSIPKTDIRSLSIVLGVIRME